MSRSRRLLALSSLAASAALSVLFALPARADDIIIIRGGRGRVSPRRQTSTFIYGSPIPAPVPVNPVTGRRQQSRIVPGSSVRRSRYPFGRSCYRYGVSECYRRSVYPRPFSDRDDARTTITIESPSADYHPHQRHGQSSPIERNRVRF